MQAARYASKPGTITLIGTYQPRMCGIATFTTDLREALAAEMNEGDCWAVAVNDIAEGYEYPPEVRFEISQGQLQQYQLAADFLNMNLADVVCLQHEFGIFGGRQGSHILALLRELRMPVVTTLHTVSRNLEPSQREVMVKLLQLSDRLVVMSEHCCRILHELYRISEERIDIIPHGIPDIPFIDPHHYKDQFGVDGRKVLLTFGLLSPGKGLEYVIDALPEVVAKYPETMYIILGATHPHIKKESGEKYRLSLQQRARQRKVEKHLVFHNRFVSLQELCEFLICADLYITPNLNRDQAVSGTLAYAMGAGKAIISTPYRYAEEMLADGRGVLVPFADASAIAGAILGLFNNERELNALRKRAYTHSRGMVWKEVARRYLDVFARLEKARLKKMYPAHGVPKKGAEQYELPEIKLDHLRLLTDSTGILQHARFIVPDRRYGYTTDDNARALIAVLMARDKVNEWDLDSLASRYLSFLDYAFNEQTGRFRNFLRYDRTWAEEAGSNDCQGRALWGLGTAIWYSPWDSQVAMAMDLFERALPAMESIQSPRAWAFALLGIHANLQRFVGNQNARRMAEVLADRLFHRIDPGAPDGWPWIEEKLAYANGKIPHALILAGTILGREDMLHEGLRLLDWLLGIQKDPLGYFVPVGNQQGSEHTRAQFRFDQQPIEAQAMIEACAAAYNATGQERWVEEGTLCFEWFLGRNDLQAHIYDYTTGGCWDGLQANRVNQNQGAESTLAWLISLLSMHNLRAQASSLALSASTEREQSGTAE